MQTAGMNIRLNDNLHHKNYTLEMTHLQTFSGFNPNLARILLVSSIESETSPPPPTGCAKGGESGECFGSFGGGGACMMWYPVKTRNNAYNKKS